MEIKIETAFIPVVFELKREAPEGVTVDVEPVRLSRDFGSQELAVAVITLAAGVPVNLFSSWLFEKLKNKKRTKITVAQKEIECDEGEIRRIVEKYIQIEQGD